MCVLFLHLSYKIKFLPCDIMWTPLTIVLSRRLFVHSCSVQHVRARGRNIGDKLVFTYIIDKMGVHDNADSKYSVMGASSFSKLAPKRPNTVVFNDTPSKIQKYEDTQQTVQTENVDKGIISLQQQRKSLPVYRLRKR